jgi:ABC-type multidrug transport system permease subunit
MRGVLKILAKDAAELLANPRMLVLALAIPPLILLLVGQLNKRPAAVKVRISGLAECNALRGYQGTRTIQADLGAGFLPLSLTPEQRQSLGSADGTGVLVSTVKPGGTAAEATVQEGDLLVAVNGSPINGPDDVETVIGGARPGDDVALTVIRGGVPQNLTARLGASEPPESAVFRYLDALSHVTVDCWPAAERDPYRSISSEGTDLLLNIEEGRWALYTAETNPRRMERVLNLAQGIRLAHSADIPVYYKLSVLGALPLRPALLYYPESADSSLALIPMTYSLIVCFLAFILAAPSLIRERELRTLEILLSAPGIDGRTVLIGKTLLPIAVSLFTGIVMLAVVQAVYGLYVKSNVVLFLLFLILPILSSTLLGLLVSALARSQVQTVMASAIYFFCLLLLSGFLFPTEAGATGIQLVTRLFGLTYLIDPANAWFFGADPFRDLHWMPLAVQCLVYSGLAAITWRSQLKKI